MIFSSLNITEIVITVCNQIYCMQKFSSGKRFIYEKKKLLICTLSKEIIHMYEFFEMMSCVGFKRKPLFFMIQTNS